MRQVKKGVAMDEELLEIVQVFVAQGRRFLDDSETRLLALLDTPAGPETESHIASLFRCLHSLKGGAASLNLDHISDLTHTAETILNQFQKEKNASLRPMSTSCSSLIDLLRNCLTTVEATTSGT